MIIRKAVIVVVGICLFAVSPVIALDEIAEGFDPIELDGRVLRTTRHRITVAESGLPAQIYIEAQPHELPLEMRGQEVAENVLRNLGRGPQLRKPVRLEATIDGAPAETKVTRAAEVVDQNDAEVTYRSKLQLGPVGLDLTVNYQFDGGFVAEITYRGGGNTIDSFDLKMDVDGPVSLAWAGPRVGKKGIEAVAGLDPVLPPDTEKTVWKSVEEMKTINRGGTFVPFLLFGSPDRSFTWICDDSGGWMLDESEPAMTISRDKAGDVTWSASFVNHTVKATGKRTVRFALLTHPARRRPTDFRRRQWVNWPTDARQESLQPGLLTVKKREKLLRQAARSGRNRVLSAMTGGSMEASARYMKMEGGSGGVVPSAEQDNLDTFPAGLFSVFAGTSTGLMTRIASNVREKIPAGAAPRYDRQILGRALVHDIGAGLKGLSQPAHYSRLLRVLAEFGFFEDEKTEIIPYWRNGRAVRYGEEFTRGGAFELSRENPAAGVYVTVYRRPHGDGGFKAIFVIMNERDNPVRERLYVMDPARIFGTRNGLTAPAITRMTDFAGVPDDSDWRQSRIARRMGGRGDPAYALMDLEDHGVVLYSDSKGQDANIYGPLFVRAHDYRIVYGVSR